AEDGIRDFHVTGVQTCALPIFLGGNITACNVYRIDPTDADDLTRAEMLARKRVLQFFNFIREHLPGFEKAELASIAPAMGFRDRSEERRVGKEWRARWAWYH